MRWEYLPHEIRLLIIQKRNKMRQNAAKQIQKQWNKFQAPKQTAIYLWEKSKRENPDNWNPDYPSIIFPETAMLMKFTAKVLTGKEDEKYWWSLFDTIAYCVWLDEYTGGPSAVYHNKIDNHLKTLEKKFNMQRHDFEDLYIHDAI